MRHQHERAGKIDQAFFQNFERRNVEVVSRFVEQKNVGRLKHELRDQNPRAFASGKAADGLAELLAGKQESRRPSGYVNYAIPVHDGIAVRCERAAQSYVGIEGASLVEVHDAQPIGAANLATGWAQISLQQTQQGRLSAAVGAYETHPHSRRQDEVDAVK